MGPKNLGLEVRANTHRMISRSAGLEVKRRLERLCECVPEFLPYQANKNKVPAHLADQPEGAESSIRAKWPANVTALRPMSKQTQLESPGEDEMGTWMECKMTEALGQLEVMSLKESIIGKAWARWEEGLRLAHRQWEIGEAATRMETMGDQPILVL